MSKLPAPPFGPEVDVCDVPIPREAFAQMLAAQFGMPIADVRNYVDQRVDVMEGRITCSRQVKRRECRRH